MVCEGEREGDDSVGGGRVLSVWMSTWWVEWWVRG